MKLNSYSVILIKLFILQYLSVLGSAEDFDFFYLVQQWPGAYCDLNRSCCYPKSGKPAANFGLHGLWPYYKEGGYPKNCDSTQDFNRTEISDLVGTLGKEWPDISCPRGDGYRFWKKEWKKHGKCSESQLSQHQYFEAALKLKQKANVLQALTNAGIKPDDGFYELEKVKNAIKKGVGFTPVLQCNVDKAGNNQLYLILLCVNTAASDLIKCPSFPNRGCASSVQFAKF